MEPDPYGCRTLAAGEDRFPLPDPVVQAILAANRGRPRLKLVADTLLAGPHGFCDLGCFRGLEPRHARALYQLSRCQATRDYDWVTWFRALEVNSP